MTVQDAKHHNRLVGDEIKNAVLENWKIQTADVGEADGIQKSIGRKIIKTFVSLGQKTLIQTGLLSGIPLGTGLKVSLNERMKVERRHFCGRG